MIRVLVVDDHRIVRDGLQVLLGALDGITVAGTASDGLEAVRAVAELPPRRRRHGRLDAGHQRGGGDAADHRRASRVPSPHAHHGRGPRDDPERAPGGARGYLLKGAGAEEVEQAIRLAAAGGTVFGGAVGAQLVDVVTGRAAPEAVPFPELTPREREVLDLLAAGRSNAEIAGRV